jgi:hypothetical protein
VYARGRLVGVEFGHAILDLDRPAAPAEAAVGVDLVDADLGPGPRGVEAQPRLLALVEDDHDPDRVALGTVAGRFTGRVGGPAVACLAAGIVAGRDRAQGQRERAREHAGTSHRHELEHASPS